MSTGIITSLPQPPKHYLKSSITGTYFISFQVVSASEELTTIPLILYLTQNLSSFLHLSLSSSELQSPFHLRSSLYSEWEILRRKSPRMEETFHRISNQKGYALYPKTPNEVENQIWFYISIHLVFFSSFFTSLWMIIAYICTPCTVAFQKEKHEERKVKQQALALSRAWGGIGHWLL